MNEQSALYWNGGSFTMVIEDHRACPQEHGSEATELLEEFRSTCHKYYFAFGHATLGYKAQHERYGQFIEPANYENRISTGSSFPNAKQSPGRSTIAQMTQGELLKGLEDGGLFEDHVAKSLVVVIYHLWNEYYRPRIAKAVSAEPNQVVCELLGDIRRVRNLIIHESSVVPGSFANSLTFLPQIWNFESTELRITSGMVHSLMEQLNALRLTITDPRASANCQTCGKSL